MQETLPRLSCTSRGDLCRPKGFRVIYETFIIIIGNRSCQSPEPEPDSNPFTKSSAEGGSTSCWIQSWNQFFSSLFLYFCLVLNLEE